MPQYAAHSSSKAATSSPPTKRFDAMTFSQPTRTSVATTAVVVPRFEKRDGAGLRHAASVASSRWHGGHLRAHPARFPREAPLRASSATGLVGAAPTSGACRGAIPRTCGQSNSDPVAHGTLCGLQDPYDLESALAIGQRSQPGLYAGHEVLVLDAQRLVHLQVGRDDVAVPVGHRHCGEVSAVGHRGDALVVHLDALLGLEVVEDDHLVAADHRDLANLLRIQPARRARWRTHRGRRSTASAARRPRAADVRCAPPSTPPSTGTIRARSSGSTRRAGPGRRPR